MSPIHTHANKLAKPTCRFAALFDYFFHKFHKSFLYSITLVISAFSEARALETVRWRAVLYRSSQAHFLTFKILVAPPQSQRSSESHSTDICRIRLGSSQRLCQVSIEAYKIGWSALISNAIEQSVKLRKKSEDSDRTIFSGNSRRDTSARVWRQ